MGEPWAAGSVRAAILVSFWPYILQNYSLASSLHSTSTCKPGCLILQLTGPGLLAWKTSTLWCAVYSTGCILRLLLLTMLMHECHVNNIVKYADDTTMGDFIKDRDELVYWKEVNHLVDCCRTNSLTWAKSKNLVFRLSWLVAFHDRKMESNVYTAITTTK